MYEKDTLVLFHAEQEAGPLNSDSGQAQNSNGGSSETQLRTDEKRMSTSTGSSAA